MRDMPSKFVEILDFKDAHPRISDSDVRLEDVLADHEAILVQGQSRPRTGGPCISIIAHLAYVAVATLEATEPDPHRHETTRLSLTGKIIQEKHTKEKTVARGRPPSLPSDRRPHRPSLRPRLNESRYDNDYEDS
ncbi:uncharacterized protein DSM5745_10421 [Aspergillus mulundensis]|uniref:Uncharacterized protein n=1 Tax=Aspergillus mulundensis TaxID=1810919 RepID=A0A3D8QIZ3_9EURO|nr:hypothetical protein DSM5745_10421 [Aspergillus mulundensis]RDW61749.1 hypothetical protein DSM5745_10421 [Aspergillus mulundensis]